MSVKLAWGNPDEKKKDLSKEDNEKPPDENEAPSWREFTQNTTFHGIKYIFGETACIRKSVIFTISTITVLFHQCQSTFNTYLESTCRLRLIIPVSLFHVSHD